MRMGGGQGGKGTVRTLKQEVDFVVVRESSHQLMLVSLELLDVMSWKEKKNWAKDHLLCLHDRFIQSFSRSGFSL